LDTKIVAGVSIRGYNLIFRASLPYNGPSFLVGRRTGTFPAGSIQVLILRRRLAQNGVDVSRINIIPMGPGDAVTAISADRLDAAFLPQPSPAIIELSCKGR